MVENPADGGAADASNSCPTHLRFNAVATRTRSDLGWTGFGHGIRRNDEEVFTLEVKGCDSECRRCRIEGPVQNLGVNNQRCLSDSRKTCASDEECGEGGACRFMPGPPLAVTFGSRPQCTVLYFEREADGGPSVRGRIDFLTGDIDFEVFHVRSSNNTRADGSPGGTCSQCIGDPRPNDGVAEGTCTLGVGDVLDESPALGDACDANGFGSALPGTYSFDCPVSRAIPGLSFRLLDYSTGGVVWTLDETHPPCTRAGLPEGLRCWCGVCEDEPARACGNDADCPSGRCGLDDPGASSVPTAPSGCMGACEWDPVAARGQCDSAAMPGTRVGCFPYRPGDTLEARGEAIVREGQYFVTLGTLSCLSPSPIASTNVSLGLPGPGMFHNQYRVVPEFRN